MRDRPASAWQLGRAALVLLLACQSGCMPARGGWDVKALAVQVPALESMDGSRLGDLPPHAVPIGGDLTLFLCRWVTPAVIPVSLPVDASVEERVLLRRALAAWGAAGLGVSFEERERAPSGIEIAFATEDSAGAQPQGTGDTIADCELGFADTTGRTQARLRHASILLRRSNSDPLGRRVALSADELVGAVLHELGHALGFSGHVAVDSSVMAATTESVRSAGERLNGGDAFADATLLALYSVPSGVVVRRVPLAPDTSSMYRRLASLASAQGLDGPLTRVGDRSARIFWRNVRGAPVSLRIRDWPGTLERSRQIVFQPNPLAQLLMKTGALPADQPD